MKLTVDEASAVPSTTGNRFSSGKRLKINNKLNSLRVLRGMAGGSGLMGLGQQCARNSLVRSRLSPAQD
jgi:hypothetical protein